METKAPTTILRLEEVIRRTGLCKSSIYETMRVGDFPKPLKLTARARGWRELDIERWLESRQEAT